MKLITDKLFYDFFLLFSRSNIHSTWMVTDQP